MNETEGSVKIIWGIFEVSILYKLLAFKIDSQIYIIVSNVYSRFRLMYQLINQC